MIIVTYEDGTTQKFENPDDGLPMIAEFSNGPKKGYDRIWTQPPRYGKIQWIPARSVAKGHHIKIDDDFKVVASVETLE